jgi:hypothetical protein
VGLFTGRLFTGKVENRREEREKGSGKKEKYASSEATFHIK